MYLRIVIKFLFVVVFIISSSSVASGRVDPSSRPRVQGKATYYKFNGSPVAIYHETGIIFDSGSPMAAISERLLGPKKFSYFDLVRIRNRRNGCFTYAFIVDNGPLRSGRVIDLSPYSFEKLCEGLNVGVLDVDVELVERYCQPPQAGNKMPNCRVDPRELSRKVVSLKNSLEKDNNIQALVQKPLTHTLGLVSSVTPPPIKQFLSSASQIKNEISAWLLIRNYLAQAVNERKEQAADFQHFLFSKDMLQKSKEMSYAELQAILQQQHNKIVYYRNMNVQLEAYNLLNSLNYGVYPEFRDKSRIWQPYDVAHGIILLSN